VCKKATSVEKQLWNSPKKGGKVDAEKLRKNLLKSRQNCTGKNLLEESLSKRALEEGAWGRKVL